MTSADFLTARELVLLRLTHRCTDRECCSYGQATDRGSCSCHRTPLAMAVDMIIQLEAEAEKRRAA